MANASGPMAAHLENPSEAAAVPLNRWGVVGMRDLFGRGPHVDALQIGAAVEELCAGAVEMAGPCVPLDGGQGGDQGDDLWQEAYARAARRLPRRLMDVIIRRALTPEPGHWQEELVRRAALVAPNGRPHWFHMVERETRLKGQVERVEMIVKVDRRRVAGAYQKFRLEPAPVWAIEARATYSAWRAALDVLYFDLRGRMERVELLKSEMEWEPWAKAA